MKIKAIVLDLDGTLYNTNTIHKIDSDSVPLIHNYLAKRNLLSRMTKMEIKKMDRNIRFGDVSATVRGLSKRFGLDYTKFITYANNKRPKEYGIKRDRKLISLMSRLSKKYKILIFTNAPGIWAKRVLSAVGLSNLISFKQVICLECMGSALKPDPSAYKVMLNIAKLNKKEIIYFDDKYVNVEEGKKLGIKSIHVHNSNMRKPNSIYSILEKLSKTSG